MTIADLENADLAGMEFTPFNDTNQSRIEQAVLAVGVVSGGMDTTLIDQHRDGVNIRTARHRFNSTQPKLWAGNLNHYATVRTIGQARSFTEFGNSAAFIDQPISVSNPTHPADFNPIQYLQDPNYPLPIIFNNGPQQEEEASIEPFTIKFRRASIEGQVTARSIKANLEDGNTFDSDQQGANRIQQFISFIPPNEPRFFLDEGEEHVGAYPFVEYLLDGDSQFFYSLENSETGFIDQADDNLPLNDLNSSVSFNFGPPNDNPLNPRRAAEFDGLGGQLLTTSGSGTTFPSSSNLINAAGITADCYVYVAPTATGNNYIFSQGSPNPAPESKYNTLYALGVNPTTSELIYSFDNGNNVTNEFTFPFTPSLLNIGGWNHIQFANAVIGSEYFFIVGMNGLPVSADVVVGPPATGSLDGAETHFYVGSRNGEANTFFKGRIVSIRIRRGTDFELKEGFAKLNSVRTIYSGSIFVEGFTPLTQREIEPYNETKDERIVERIQTADTDFINALKALKFDLDNDIREDFDRKSATAGNDVYGPNASWTGTDSITYVGRIKGN